MRTIDELLTHLTIVHCLDQDHQQIWLDSLEPEERQKLEAWMQETIQSITHAFEPMYEVFASIGQQLVDGLTSALQPYNIPQSLPLRYYRHRRVRWRQRIIA